jgi:hypothetical protein
LWIQLFGDVRIVKWKTIKSGIYTHGNEVSETETQQEIKIHAKQFLELRKKSKSGRNQNLNIVELSSVSKQFLERESWISVSEIHAKQKSMMYPNTSKYHGNTVSKTKFQTSQKDESTKSIVF